MNGECYFIVRKTKHDDIARINEIYAYAREMMKRTGNPNQWITYPSKELVEQDVNSGISYVIEADGKICGTFVFYIGRDKTYENITDGAWLNENRYGVIHRIASDGSHKGILEAAVRYCNGLIGNLRMDTHRDNKIMQRSLEKNGFRFCGLIDVGDESDDGTARLAYQKINL